MADRLGRLLHVLEQVAVVAGDLDELDRLDFLIIDALLPDNGACATIQTMHGHFGASTIVIGLVPADNHDAAETCLGQGADDVIGMPCDARQLSEVLIRHLPRDAE